MGATTGGSGSPDPKFGQTPKVFTYVTGLPLVPSGLVALQYAYLCFIDYLIRLFFFFVAADK